MFSPIAKKGCLRPLGNIDYLHTLANQYLLMPKTGRPINRTINIFDKEEIEYWCEKLNCEKRELFDAIFEVGKSVKDIKTHFKKRSQTS